MKDKESAYADVKAKLKELEQKYLQCTSQRSSDQASCLRITPPLSQHTDPFGYYNVPYLHHTDKIEPETYKTYSTLFPSLHSANYEYNSWQTRQNEYYNLTSNNQLSAESVEMTSNQKLPVNPMTKPILTVEETPNLDQPTNSMVNPILTVNYPVIYQILPANQMLTPIQPVNSIFNPTPRLSQPNLLNNNGANYVPNPPHITKSGNTVAASYLAEQSSMNCLVSSQSNLPYSTQNKQTPISTHRSKVRNTGT